MNLYDKYSGVIELKGKDFIHKNNKVYINHKEFKDKNGLIMFYAPWCRHCQNMVEMWSDLAIQFKHQFTIAVVNCENKDNHKICSKIDIKYYPTIKYVSKDSLLHNYDEPYTKDDFIYFICSQI